MVHLLFLLTNLQIVDCNQTRRKFRDTVNSAVCSQWQSQQVCNKSTVAFWPLGHYSSIWTLGTDKMPQRGRKVQKCVRGWWDPVTAGTQVLLTPGPPLGASCALLHLLSDKDRRYVPCDKDTKQTRLGKLGNLMEVLGTESKQGRKLTSSKPCDVVRVLTEETPSASAVSCPPPPHPLHRGVYADHFYRNNKHNCC